MSLDYTGIIADAHRLHLGLPPRGPVYYPDPVPVQPEEATDDKAAGEVIAELREVAG